MTTKTLQVNCDELAKPNRLRLRLAQLGMTLVLFVASSMPLFAQGENVTLRITSQANGVVSFTVSNGAPVNRCGTENRYDSAVAGVSTNHGTCQIAGPQGTQITLTATPNLYYNFIGWAGDCRGDTAEIIITLNDADLTCQAVFAKPDGYVQIATSDGVKGTAVVTHHTCALRVSGTIDCWGNNSSRFSNAISLPGKLGVGDNNGRDIPTPVLNISTAIVVTAGSLNTCAVLSDGTAQCWGSNNDRQLGIGVGPIGRVGSNVPVAVVDLSTAVTASTGGSHSCAVLANGQAQCWGNNLSGQLGIGNTQSQATPTTVLNIANAIAISSGIAYTCAVLSNGTAQCWGENDNGQLGNGNTQGQNRPVAVMDITNATAINAGNVHTCALLSDGTAQCWGQGSSGQLGNGDTQNQTRPTTVSNINNVIAIDTGAAHTCAILSDGTAQCWGGNTNGELGNPGTTAAMSTVPVRVSNLNNVASISAGEDSTCAVLRNGLAYCWGSDEDGVIGNGEATGTYTAPQLVANQTLTQSPRQVLAVRDTPFVFQPKIAANVRAWSFNSFSSTAAQFRLNTASGALYGTPDFAGSLRGTLLAHTGIGNTSNRAFTLDLVVLASMADLVILDSDPSTNTIRSNAQQDEPVGGLRLGVQPINLRAIIGLDWSLTGDDAFALDSPTSASRVLVVDPTGFTTGTSVEVTVRASKDGIQSNPLPLTIHITEAVHDIRFHLKLFLEGPLQ